MNIRLKCEILTFSAATETHFESIPMLGGGGLTQYLYSGSQPFINIAISQYVNILFER